MNFVIAYTGNGAYCYANSASMLLEAAGENVSPETIEVLSGVGLGAVWFEDDHMIFFSNGVPHTGVNQALHILGFTALEHAGLDDSGLEETLRALIARQPVMFGPLDMGNLSYMPNHRDLQGSDHYALAFGIEDDSVRLHDPAGYPYASIPLQALIRAGKTDRLQYRLYPTDLAYHFWTDPKRVNHPTRHEIDEAAITYFRQIYTDAQTMALSNNWLIGREAIAALIGYLRGGEAAPGLKGHLTHFAFPVGARRALHYGRFFRGRDDGLTEIKEKQAEVFGRCQAFAARDHWTAVAEALGQMAELEERFQAGLLEG